MNIAQKIDLNIDYLEDSIDNRIRLILKTIWIVNNENIVLNSPLKPMIGYNLLDLYYHDSRLLKTILHCDIFSEEACELLKSMHIHLIKKDIVNALEKSYKYSIKDWSLFKELYSKRLCLDYRHVKSFGKLHHETDKESHLKSLMSYSEFFKIRRRSEDTEIEDNEQRLMAECTARKKKNISGSGISPQNLQ